MNLSSSFLNRAVNLKRAESEVFDLLVVGGGITGAGVAREAALRGLSVCLIERADFAEGTSSRSSKLAHGGLRYLENLEFDLVSEALQERQNLLRMAPHMVKPLRFLMPIYKGDRVSAFKMKLGMILYDVLSLFNTPKFHESISKKEIQNLYPDLKSEGLKSGFLYSDALMDDDRLVHETLRSAADEGACVLSYVDCKEYNLDKGENLEGLSVLSCVDVLNEEKITVKGKHTVSCVGPWTDQFAKVVDESSRPRMRPSKGVHISLPKDKLKLKTAVVMAADAQSRILFCIPRAEFDIIGTTDTDFLEDPSAVRTDRVDVDYILNVLKEYYPAVEISHKDILFSYAGVRPLVNDGAESESKVSRSHWIKTSLEDKVTYITGGKYTTYLSMAEECVDKVLGAVSWNIEGLSQKAPRKPFVEINNEENIKLAREKILNSDLIDWPMTERNLFVERHGAQAFKFLKEFSGKSSEELEACIAIHYYFCGSLRDFYFRRAPYLLKGLKCVQQTLPKVKEVFSEELSWTDEQASSQLVQLQKSIEFEDSWRDNTY